MTYRVDVNTRDGRAFIERMFNSRLSLDGTTPANLRVYGVALSGGRALERSAEENEQWLGLVDSHLLSISLQTRANFGTWQDGTSEGGVLCLVDATHGLAFEGLFLELASTLGGKSEEAVLVVYPIAVDVFAASLLYSTGHCDALKVWHGGQ